MVPSQHSALRGAFEWIAVIAIALVASFLIRSFVVEPFVVPTGSMEDTIEIGDQILAQKVSLELGQPVKQGDIVVFHNPDGTSEHDVLVKRVIATAGQTVDLQDGKEERDCDKCLLTAGELQQALDDLSGRRRLDFDTALQYVFRIAQRQLRLTAAEQLGKGGFEMLIDL